MNTLKYIQVVCFLMTAVFAIPAYAQTQDQTSMADLKKFQQVCKGKTAGAEVSFAHKAVIWNGTCESVFTATDRTVTLVGSEAEIYHICTNDKEATSMTINGSEVKGKCILTYTPPMPKM